MNRFPEVLLKPRRAGAAIGRHPWVFSNVIAKVSPKPNDGQIVKVLKSEDRSFVAYGIWNSSSEIRIRLYSFDLDQIPDPLWLKQKMREAIGYRRALDLLQPIQACRLIFSEADGLSGLTVDRYAQYLVVQITSLAMEKMEEEIVSVLVQELSPKGILKKEVSEKISLRESLHFKDEVLYGEVPHQPIQFRSKGIKFEIDLYEGQKTASFLDQQENHQEVAQLAKGRNVLDLYTYQGGFLLHASLGGAENGVGVDSSKKAIDQAKSNADLNQISNLSWFQADVFDFLKSNSDQKFNLLIVDPPKFISSRKDLERGLRMYYQLNLMALDKLAPQGIWVTCSCSGSVSKEEWVGLIASVAKKRKKVLRILSLRGASKDHPVNPDAPESEYLKCLISQVV